MATMKDYFSKAEPAWRVHPLVRYWTKLKTSPDISELRMELYRPRDGLSFRPAQIFVLVVRKDGAPVQPQETAWEDVLNEGLVHLGVQAVSKENEAERFSLMFQSAFEPIDARVGETYFSAVLLELVRGGPFSQGPHVAKVLAKIGRDGRPNQGTSWEDSRERIENAIAGLAHALTDGEQLHYAQADAEEILEVALAAYLDERFSVTNRDLMGW